MNLLSVYVYSRSRLPLTADRLKTPVYCQLWTKISFLNLAFGQKLMFPEPVGYSAVKMALKD